MRAFLQDLRHGARAFARQPALWALAVITLGVGVGVNATLFTIVRNVLVRPISMLDPDRTAVLLTYNAQQNRERDHATPAELAEWRARSGSFERLVAFRQRSVSLTGNGEPERLRAAAVLDGFFEFLGARMALGRTFLPAETGPGRHPVVILSHGLWQRRYAGDPVIIGRTIRLDEGFYTVVGVAAPEVWFPSMHVQLWLPLAMDRGSAGWQRRDLTVLGQLRAGVFRGAAQHEMDAIAESLATEYPDTNAGWRVQVLPPDEGFFSPEDQTVKHILYLLGAGVLLIACANVANLLLARAVGRRREIAVRLALGASRGRLLRQALAESLWLGIPAACLGLLAALWCGDFLLHSLPDSWMRIPDQGVDLTIVGFTVGVSLASVLLSSLAPAWQSARLRLSEALQEAGTRTGLARRSRRLARVFVVAQTAVALGLVASAAMMIKSVIALHRLDPGFQTANMAVITADPPTWRYASAAEAQPFYDELLRKVRAVPGVESAGAITVVPQVQGDGSPTTFLPEGRPEPAPSERPFGTYLAVTPGALETLRIPLLSGRAIHPADTAGAPRAVVINQTAARRLWEGQPAEGRRVHLDALAGEWFVVVGVCRDVKRGDLLRQPRPQFYVAAAQNPQRAMRVVARLAASPEALLPVLRQAARETDPEQAFQFNTVEWEWYEDLTGARTFTTVVVSVGGLALFLAAMGLFCLLSHQVGQQLPEIGLRMALGATAGDVVRQVTVQAMRLVATGAALGLLLAYAAGRALASVMYGLKPADPVLLPLAMIVLAGAAAIACYAPARRAATTDPAKTLRGE